MSEKPDPPLSPGFARGVVQKARAVKRRRRAALASTLALGAALTWAVLSGPKAQDANLTVASNDTFQWANVAVEWDDVSDEVSDLLLPGGSAWLAFDSAGLLSEMDEEDGFIDD